MLTQEEKAKRFLALHGGPPPLLIPNPWDLGSARVLVAMGFEALATTSGGFAAALGRVDGSVGRDEAVAYRLVVVGRRPFTSEPGTAEYPGACFAFADCVFAPATTMPAPAAPR